MDTDADRTVVPATLAEQLVLEVVDQQRFEGLGGVQVTLPIVRLRLTIRGCEPLEVNAATIDGDSYIFLGRDVLTFFRIVLDGPNRKVEIG